MVPRASALAVPSHAPSHGARPPHVGVYVHFPWCLAKCPYCDFVSYATPRESIDHGGYADAVLARARRARGRPPGARSRRPADRQRLLRRRDAEPLGPPAARSCPRGAVRRAFECAPDLEVTVECNPTSLDHATAPRARGDRG